MVCGWQKIVASVLRPERSHLDRCLAARAGHLAARARIDDHRSRAAIDCVARIDALRAVVFAANDGFVPRAMTDLEREWRALARVDPDRGLMDLWARIAPGRWIERKLWRGAPADTRLDVAVALAADADGVEAAEAAVERLRSALAVDGTRLPSAVRWCIGPHDSDVVSDLLAARLARAREEAARHHAEAIVVPRAEALAESVRVAAASRFPDRPGLVRDLSNAAFVDYLWQAAAFVALPDPVAPLRALWSTGYVLSHIDASGVTLEVPAL